uniref:Sulfotransferase family protein n=1 Tax=Odontella aurita TaxID=265563 RepID=A0A7S4K3Y2_9STRA|mmetsp:Transcript_60326/g.178675  ORF Transcript_60326/g.178675 Transcript_60326/m.178675 type:complete len:222 (+) Transcript_60326:228-893(+)
MSKADDIVKARDWGVVENNLADVVVTQRLAEVSTLFSPTHRGRVFALFRHPVKRAVDLFYYRQRSTFDPDFEGDVAVMSLKTYALSRHHVENFMVRTLLNKVGFDVTPEDVEVCKDILRRKFVVGIAEEKWFDASVVRFERYFGWWNQFKVSTNMTVNHCHYDRIKKGGHFGSHPKAQKHSEAYDILASRNWADMELVSSDAQAALCAEHRSSRGFARFFE